MFLELSLAVWVLKVSLSEEGEILRVFIPALTVLAEKCPEQKQEIHLLLKSMKRQLKGLNVEKAQEVSQGAESQKDKPEVKVSVKKKTVESKGTKRTKSTKILKNKSVKSKKK